MPKRHRCRTRVSLPHRTKCSAHPCQCQRQVKHGSCATNKKTHLVGSRSPSAAFLPPSHVGHRDVRRGYFRRVTEFIGLVPSGFHGRVRPCIIAARRNQTERPTSKDAPAAAHYWRRYGYATPVTHVPEKRIAFCKEARFPLYLLQKRTPCQTIVGFHVRLLRMARLPAKGGFLRPYRWVSYYRHKAAALQRAALTPAQAVRRLPLKGAA